ncbi:tonsoku-like protein [Elysia marginata]|uniref:Tonsoku-like protein n=1 Tax=Elysia marginata TaxID=1093978 RepID=A0AAV4IPG6_9GAST|nr:tonsoku-like protein [Elysia marginata]
MDADDAKNLQCFLREKKKAEAKNKLKEVAEFCNCIGEIYSKYGQYEDAIQEHTQELHLSEALGDKIGEAVACRKIGECHCFLGQYELALSLQKRHLVLARECENSLEEQRAWATIGKTYFCQSDSRNLVNSAHASKKAEKAYTKALEVCEKVKSSVKLEEYMAMKGRLYLNIGLVYDTRGEIKLCADVMKRAVAIAEKFKLLDEQYMCHSSLASMYYKCGQPTQAMRSVDLALKMAEKLRNKVAEKEMYIQKTQIFVSLGDYLAAKHCLKKAYKIKVMSETGDRKLMKLFQCVNKMQDAAVDLEMNTNAKRIAELKEVVADNLAELGNFSEAVEYYLATLDSKDLLTSEKRADIYVSLAQTYADLRNYDEAIFYYRQELEERKNNQEQSCRTLLNIAELEELRGSKYSVLCKIYMSAFEAARKAKHVKLQIQTLKSLIALQKVLKQNEHLKETEKKLESIARKHGISNEHASSSGDDDDEDDKDNSSDDDNDGVARRKGKPSSNTNDGNLSLSDLTLSEDESEGDNPDLATIHNRQKKSKIARRNEKGETPLHRACIDGNLKKAKALIAQGHPVNPRDFCGWLPLHEACNHGHIEVVKCLLEAGAWINDRGGERCGGVTPLIDAANCGNLAIIRLLVTRGASLHAKDDDVR